MTLVYLALAWAVGIVLAQHFTNAPAVFWLFIALFSTIGAAILRRSYTGRLLLVCAAFLALGVLRMLAVATPPDSTALSRFNGRGWREFEGVIATEPDIRDQFVNLRVRVDITRLYESESATAGLALVQAGRYGGYAYGDRVIIRGTPLDPPEFDDFSYRDYLARQHVFTLIPNADVEIISRGHGNPFLSTLLSLKRYSQTLISNALPEPQASLLTGILLGVETGIAPEVRDAFNATGTSHVIAISGFNMTLIAGLLSRLLSVIWPSRRRLTAGFSIIAVGVYTIFVGANPAVLRAALMSSLLILAPLLNRRTYVPASLAFAAILMSAFDPYVLWDIGFQLSFAAVIGLALFVTPLEDSFRRVLSSVFSKGTVEKLLRLLSEPLIVTLAAQITTLPLIAHYFGRFSLSSFVVNFLILPAQTPLLLFGGAATLVALVMPFLAQPLYWGAWVFLTWTIGAVRFFAGIPGGDLAIAMDANLTGAFYLAVTTGAIARGTNPDWRSAVGSVLRKRRFGLALLGAGGIMTALLWPAVFALPDGRMHVHFLDSGHSNAVLIETPRGAQILVDGGKYPTRLLTALGDHMPFWDRNIELLILTQPKASQFAAIPSVLERYTIGQVLTNGQPSDSDTYTALTGALSQQAIPVLPVSRGYVVETNEGVRLEVLYPLSTPGEEDEPTDAGLVLRLSYGEASFLLAPDLSSAAETTLIESGQWLHGSVLQLPAHGSDNVSSQSFLDAVAPQLAVVQVDTGNRFGHPAEAVLARLGNTPLYRTDQSGEITFSTDGTTLWVNSEDQQ